ncbi:hypothetical protein MBLNU457_7155t1 [Dothideomycetes sp. NU457]
MAPLPDYWTVPMIAVSAVFLAICWLTVTLRFYVRGFIAKSIGWDDWTIVLATLVYTGFAACIFQIGHMELTSNMNTIAAYQELALVLPTAFALYIASTIILKISLSIFFLRILVKKWQRNLILGATITYVAFASIYWFIDLFHCGNPADYFIHQVENKCLNFARVVGPLTYTHSALNAVTDWIYALVPVFVVWQSQMTTRARATVSIILLLGVVGSVCSVVRTAYVDVLGVSLNKILSTAPKFAILSIIEVGLGIAAINMATLRPLFKTIFGSTRGGTSRHAYGPSARRTPAGTVGTHGVRTLAGVDEDGDEVELQPKNGGISVVTQFSTTFADKESLEEV